jgi:hypothetical protein
MSKGFIITLVIILVLVFVPIIPFKSLELHDTYAAGSGNTACVTKFYSVSGLINLYNEKAGSIISGDYGTKQTNWHFLSCY